MAQLVLSVEALKVVDRANHHLFVDLKFYRILNPRVLERFGGRNAQFRVFLHKFANKIFCFRGHVLPIIVRERIGTFFDARDDSIVGPACKGRLAGEQDIKDHADAPEVTLFCVCSGKNFGRDIVGGTVEIMHLFVVAYNLGSAKVDNFNQAAIFRVYQDIFGLQITMAYLMVVAVRNCLEDLFCDNCRLFFVELLPAGDFLEKLLALTKLGNDENFF